MLKLVKLYQFTKTYRMLNYPSKITFLGIFLVLKVSILNIRTYSIVYYITSEWEYIFLRFIQILNEDTVYKTYNSLWCQFILWRFVSSDYQYYFPIFLRSQLYILTCFVSIYRVSLMYKDIMKKKNIRCIVDSGS